jgi:acetolactate synthase-1/2/3 large subunit
MSAVSYAKQTGGYGVTYVTTGCGGTNTVTGLLDAWQDSVPCIFISGQAKLSETIRNSGLKLRQFGVQEVDVVTVVQPLTKYAVMVADPYEIAYHLEKASFIAKNGRPGPVWLDIPLDIQAAEIDEAKLKHFTDDEASALKERPAISQEDLKELILSLTDSRRPIVIAGQGIRLAGSIDEFRLFIEKLKIPVVASRLGIDLLPSNHNLFIGRIGNKGDRAGNFALQNADCVISLGSRLSVSSTGHEYRTFAREAKLFVVDIDSEEHEKKTVKIHRFIHADVKDFLKGIIKNDIRTSDDGSWVACCRKWKTQWPVCLPEYADSSKGINLYYFTEVLSSQMSTEDTIISDAGSAFYVISQAVKLKEGQRYITSGAQAEMGYTLPACIGVAFAKNKGNTVGVTGDGSLQMNIQELQTIVHHNIPVKLFVWNNDGYLSIRATQSKFCAGRFIGTDSGSGVSFPNLRKIAKAYGLKYFRISHSRHLASVIRKVLRLKTHVICEVMCIRDQEIIPSVASEKNPDGRLVSKPLEDMYPFLPREEFLKNMIIRPLEEK